MSAEVSAIQSFRRTQLGRNRKTLAIAATMTSAKIAVRPESCRRAVLATSIGFALTITYHIIANALELKAIQVMTARVGQCQDQGMRTQTTAAMTLEVKNDGECQAGRNARLIPEITARFSLPVPLPVQP